MGMRITTIVEGGIGDGATGTVRSIVEQVDADGNITKDGETRTKTVEGGLLEAALLAGEILQSFAFTMAIKAALLSGDILAAAQLMQAARKLEISVSQEALNV